MTKSGEQRKKSQTLPFYLLLGPESGEKETFISKIRENLKRSHGEAPEEHRFYPFKLEMAELTGLLSNESLFSQHRLVLLYNAEAFTKKAEVDPLVSYLGAPSESSTLICISDEYRLDKRIEKVVPKNQSKIFWELFENQKQSWIQNFVRKAGLSIQQDAVELILELVENDTSDLKRECEKLVLYYPEGTTITENEVEHILYHSKNENVFSLFARIAEADFASAVETLHAITLAGPTEPTSILAGLSWQIKKLLGYRRLKDSNYSDEDAGRKLSIRGKRNLRTYQTGARNFTMAELERIFVRTFDYDVRFREMRTGVDKKILELFLYEIVVQKGSSPLFSRT